MPRKSRLKAERAGEHQADLEIQVVGARRGKQKEGTGGPPTEALGSERVPRISRLMALAIKFEDMIARGELHDYADLARLGYVTRARMTQIMNLLLLAPEIQEQILFLKLDPCSAIGEPQMRDIIAEVDWHLQRTRWLERMGDM
jgi:hypothetical protein